MVQPGLAYLSDKEAKGPMDPHPVKGEGKEKGMETGLDKEKQQQ